MSDLFIQCICAFMATISFSLLFGVPVRYYPWCGFIGGAGWIFYLLAKPATSTPVATFIATVGVILMSRFFAVRKRCPVTIFLIAGIFPLVPGAGIYWSAFYMVSNELATAASTGFEALKSVIAIVLAIVFVFELPQKLFCPPKNQKTTRF